MDVTSVALAVWATFASWAAWYWYVTWRRGLEGFVAASQRADGARRNEEVMHELFVAEKKRVDALVRQNQRLAQQLATLRVRHDAEPVEMDVAPPDPDPLDAQIVEYMSSIDSSEARDIVEAEVEGMIEAGLDTAAILSRLYEGD